MGKIGQAGHPDHLPPVLGCHFISLPINIIICDRIPGEGWSNHSVFLFLGQNFFIIKYFIDTWATTHPENWQKSGN
jgi:hypothetical protein